MSLCSCLFLSFLFEGHYGYNWKSDCDICINTDQLFIFSLGSEDGGRGSDGAQNEGEGPLDTHHTFN